MTQRPAGAAGPKRWVRPNRVSAGLYGALFTILVFFGFAGLASGAVGPAVFGLVLLVLAAGEVWLYVRRHYKSVTELEAKAAQRRASGR